MKGERGGENVTRHLLLDYIADHPGVTFQMLLGTFRMKESTLRYHLEYLRFKEEIIERKAQGFNRYFSNIVKDGRTWRMDRKVHPSVRRAQRLLNVIKENPGITRDGLKMMMDLPSKELTTSLSKLKESGQIWGRENGGTIHYEAVTRERLLDEVLISLIRKLVNGELDERTFLSLKEEIDRERKCGP